LTSWRVAREVPVVAASRTERPQLNLHHSRRPGGPFGLADLVRGSPIALPARLISVVAVPREEWMRAARLVLPGLLACPCFPPGEAPGPQLRARVSCCLRLLNRKQRACVGAVVRISQSFVWEQAARPWAPYLVDPSRAQNSHQPCASAGPPCAPSLVEDVDLVPRSSALLP